MTTLQLIGLIIWLLFPTVCGVLAFQKERGVVLWVILGALFGAFALVVIALLPSKNKWDAIERRAPVLEPPLLPPEPETYGKCPECGRIAFTADGNGDFYCSACSKTVQVVSPSQSG
jgi:hypothetical protein